MNVVTTADTKFHAKGIQNPTLADIKVGDIVVVVGQLNGDTLTASHVGFHTPRAKTRPGWPRGKISGHQRRHADAPAALRPNADRHDRRRTPSSCKRGDDGLQVIKVSDLTVGEGVAVLGIRSSDGRSMAAKAIIAGKGEDAAPQPQPNAPLSQHG